MSAQTRNDSRYERQAHAHLLQAHDLTTSAKGGASYPAPPITTCTTCSLTRYSPSRAFSGVMGSERTWWPVACATAEATAASGVLMTTSPIDLAPNGPVGS